APSTSPCLASTMSMILSHRSFPFFFDFFHQGPDSLFAHVELESGALEQFAEAARPAQGEPAFIVRQRRLFVFQRLEPYLQGAQLGDAVFDVIERHLKNMQL